ERAECGDPAWRVIPSSAKTGAFAVAHLRINDEDLLADPEIARPVGMLRRLVEEGVVGAAAERQVGVMGYQDGRLKEWRETTAPAIVGHLREQEADGLILAPA